MKILVACEESQAVTKQLRSLGHEAYSCDIKETTGTNPEWHITGDAIKEAYSGKYDMMIAFPPCTHLATSGARWFKEKIADGRQQEGVDFFMKMINAPINKIAVENPVGVMSTKYKKPNQIIQPYQYGDEFQKSTCLWLKGLPELKPTNVVGKGEMVTWINNKGVKRTRAAWFSKIPKAMDRSTYRSKTFNGIAEAMAYQWAKAATIEEI
jgi:hypothetical protein|tara:strand:+ start:1798 stop:2427 length:630 start_codon:yes stop_codon:yes gene_type:complete